MIRLGVPVCVGLGAAAVAGIFYQRIGARRDRRRFPPSGRLVDVGGHRLHVVVRGSGAPFVLLESAIAASSLSWFRVQHALAPHATVCAYDRAGLGWSDPSPEPPSLARVLGDLRTLLPRDTRSILVGHSFGAFVCLAYAAQYPAETAGLVLVDPPTDWTNMSARQAGLLRGAVYLSRFGALLARLGVVRVCLTLLTGGLPAAPRYFVKVFGATTSGTLERLVGEVRKLPPDVHPLVKAAWCQPKCFRAMADYLRVFEEAARSARHVDIQIDLPLVVISAADQPSDVVDAHRRIARCSSRGRHVLAADSGHWVLFDAPDVIVDAVREILR